MFSVAGPWDTLSHISPKSPMIKSKPITLPSNWFHSQSDSHSSIYSGSSGIIISNVLRIHVMHRATEHAMRQYATNTRHRTPPRARMLCLFPIELVEQRRGCGSSVPRPTICVRASSHTAGNRLRKYPPRQHGVRRASRRKSGSYTPINLLGTSWMGG